MLAPCFRHLGATADPCEPRMLPALAETLSEALPEAERRHRRVRELMALLERLGGASTLGQRLDALERLARWVTATDRTIPVASDAAGARWRRLDALIGLLERLPELRAAAGAAPGAACANTVALCLLAATRLPNERW